MSTSLIRNNKPKFIEPPKRPMENVHPHLIHTTPETLLLATISYLREKLPGHQFKVERVTEQEAVITHYLKDGGIEFFRLKLSR